MTEYYIPTREGVGELVEKRSRFLGHVWRVSSEEEAREKNEATKKKHYDAGHNRWSYIIKDGPTRYSDDGEPQGTAGQPMLNVFQREGVVNVCCVVTRYFGGILLGAGGLVRAYTQSAKDALDGAGISVVRRWVAMEVPCTYAQFEQARRTVEDMQDLALGRSEMGQDGADTLRTMYPFLDDSREQELLEQYRRQLREAGDGREKAALQNAAARMEALIAKKAQMKQEFINKLRFLSDRATEALAVFTEPGFAGALDQALREAVGAEEPPPEDGEGGADGAAEPGAGAPEGTAPGPEGGGEPPDSGA